MWYICFNMRYEETFMHDFDQLIVICIHIHFLNQILFHQPISCSYELIWIILLIWCITLIQLTFCNLDSELIVFVKRERKITKRKFIARMLFMILLWCLILNLLCLIELLMPKNRFTNQNHFATLSLTLVGQLKKTWCLCVVLLSGTPINVYCFQIWIWMAVILSFTNYSMEL